MTPDAIPTLAITRTCPYAPPAQHQQLRQQAPITQVKLPSGVTAWAITRHEDVKTVLSNPQFSANRSHPGFPQLSRVAVLSLAKKPLLISMDGQEHAAARRAVVGEFSVKRITALAPRIQQIVDQHIDAMLAGPPAADLVQALALPVPSLVICELLGVPYAEHEFFQTRSANLVSRKAANAEKARSFGELTAYLKKLVIAKEENPTDDLLGRQILKGRQEGTYDQEAMVNMAFLLLIAGHETTANMISLSMLILLQQPDKLAALRHDPQKTPAAVEELLRYFTIAEGGVGRVAIADVELGGVLIRAGEGVVLLSNMANRDPEVFAQGAELDLDRSARNHLSFGFGPHQCLGQNLARLELQIVIDTLLRRIPTLRLAGREEDLPFKDDATVYGLYEFPVAW